MRNNGNNVVFLVFFFKEWCLDHVELKVVAKLPNLFPTPSAVNVRKICVMVPTVLSTSIISFVW
jgi:hypothetical protein